MISNLQLSEAIREFLEHGILAYSGVVIARDPDRSGRVAVLSYTECPEGMLPTEEEAKAKIAQSQKIVDQLRTSNVEFERALQGKKIIYEFCRDYGTPLT